MNGETSGLVLSPEGKVVAAVRVERRVEVNEVHGLAGQGNLVAQDIEAVVREEDSVHVGMARGPHDTTDRAPRAKIAAHRVDAFRALWHSYPTDLV